MKKITFGLCLITCLLATSCIKEKTILKEANTITGLWTGVIKNAASSYQPYNLSIKPDNTLTFEGLMENNIRHYGHGTWFLNDSVFMANVITDLGSYNNVGVQQELFGIFNKKIGTLTKCKYRNTNPANDSGIFLVEKVK